MRHFRQEEGYSLIEVLTVISIVAILAGLVSLSVFHAMKEASLSRERDMLVANIEEAKARSISSRPSGIRFLSGGTSYEVIVMKGNCSTSGTLCNGDSDCAAPQYCSMGSFRYDGNASRITVLSTQDLGYGVSIGLVRATPSGECGSSSDNLLWFDRKGIPRCSNWGLGMTTLSLTKAGSVKTVTIDSAGRTKYEN